MQETQSFRRFASHISEVPRNSPKIQTYTSSWSSKVIELGDNRKRTCNFLVIINSNFGRISHRFRDIDAFSSKVAYFPSPSLFDAPSIWMKLNWLAKTKLMGLP